MEQVLSRLIRLVHMDMVNMVSTCFIGLLGLRLLLLPLSLRTHLSPDHFLNGLKEGVKQSFSTHRR
jgi:hypothetical protein